MPVKNKLMEKPSITKYAIVPDTRIFKNLGQTGEAGYKCIAELIDNSLDARGQYRATVNVNYTTKGGRVRTITVEDDCSGMTEAQLVDAFKIGKAIKKDASQIGRFGMGLKTAIAALGTSWSVSTATESCKVAHQISENLDTFVKNNTWEIEIASVAKVMPIEETRGTSISITGCEFLNASLFERDLNSNLGDLFKHFINSGQLILTVNEVQVAPSSIRVLKEGLTEIDTMIDGKAVTGWMGLRDIGTQNYGFSLIRHNRVIESNVKIGFTPHPAHNRIVGEIHINEFDTNHHKTSFNRNNDNWANFETYITEAVKPLLALARDLSNRDKKKINEKINELLAKTLQDLLNKMKLEDIFKELTTGANEGEAPSAGIGMPDSKDASRGTASNPDKERKNNPPKGSSLNGLSIRHEFGNDGLQAIRKRWELIEGVLVVITNTDHPTFITQANQHSYAMQNCQESIAGFYATVEAGKLNHEYVNYDTYDRVLDTLYRLAATVSTEPAE